MSGKAGWLADSSKATTLWGVSLFINSIVSKKYGMDSNVMTLMSRIADIVTASFFVQQSVLTRAQLTGQPWPSYVLALSTGLLGTGTPPPPPISNA